MNELYHKIFGDDPDYRRRLWIATAIIFAAPMIRTGWADLPLRLLLTPFREAPIAGLVFLMIGAVFSLFPAGLFLLWSRARHTQVGLPWHSYLLLGLLLSCMPIQLVLHPNFYSEDNYETYNRIKEALPWIQLLRHLDKPALLLLAAWAWWRGPRMDAKAQVSFDCLLFLCLIWALSALVDANLGMFFLLP